MITINRIAREASSETRSKGTVEPLQGDDECCKICGRVSFGLIVYLGFHHWRHEECKLGSEEWNLYYQTQPKRVKEVYAEFHKFTYQKGAL